ncbi:MAG: ABC transporter substrate-binding protein, partial [Neobacillus sp.]
MFKKGLSLVIILLLAFALTACGGNKQSAAGKTTIEFMHSSVEQERLAVINKLVAKFEKENPDITVKQVPVQEDSYNTKIVTLANSGKLPAVLEVGQDYAKVMDKDKLIDQDAVKTIINQVGEKNYYDGALKLMRTENGNSYTGVPISGWVQGIWYNKEMLAAKGLQEPKNWDDVIAIAKAFTDKGNKKYGIALPTVEGGFSEQAFSQFALSNNANVLDGNGNLNMNTPAMKEALTYYKELS